MVWVGKVARFRGDGRHAHSFCNLPPGVYTRGEDVHEYPCYEKHYEGTAKGGETHFFFRDSGDGHWLISSQKDDIELNQGRIRSRSAADTPTEHGLEFEYFETGSNMLLWRHAANMTCTEVSELGEAVMNDRVEEVKRLPEEGNEDVNKSLRGSGTQV